MGGHRAALVVKRPSGDQIFVNDKSLAEFFLGRVANAGYQVGMVEDRADVVAASLAAQCELGFVNGEPSHCLGTALCRARGKLPRGAWQALRRLNRAANEAKHCWPGAEAVWAEQYFDEGDYNSSEAEQLAPRDRAERPDHRERAASGRWADFSPGCTGSEADCKEAEAEEAEAAAKEAAEEAPAQAASEEAAASKAAEEEAASCAAVNERVRQEEEATFDFSLCFTEQRARQEKEAAAEQAAEDEAARAAAAKEKRKKWKKKSAARRVAEKEAAQAAAEERVRQEEEDNTAAEE